MQTRFKYRAADADGHVRTGIFLAENPDQVIDRLSEQDLVPIEVRPAGGRSRFSFWGFFGGSHYERLIMFTANLFAMYRAGIPILRILTLIKIGPENGRFSQAISDIRLAVLAGRPLSQAMAAHDDLFSRVYTASIAAGEESGKLDDILDQLRTMLQQELELSRAIKAGIRYPIMVISALFAAALILLFYVVPKFTAFYDQFGAQLPWPTRFLIGFQSAAANYWPAVLVVAVLGGFSLNKYLKSRSGRLWIDRKMLRIPIFGQLIVKGNVARFSMMFHILFRSGLPIIACLDILGDAVKNTAIGGEIRRMGELFREGKESRLAESEFELFPPLALQMMSIGLESGSLSDILAEVSEHFRKEVDYTSRQLTAILEPILTLILGVFVLILALAIFLPMWNLIKVFNGPR